MRDAIFSALLISVIVFAGLLALGALLGSESIVIAATIAVGTEASMLFRPRRR